MLQGAKDPLLPEVSEAAGPEGIMISPREWGETLEQCVHKWRKIPWAEMSSAADLMQRLAWCEREIEALQVGDAFEWVLKGVLFALAISTVERSGARGVPRLTQIRVGNLCQRHLVHMGEIPVDHRRLLFAATASHKIFMSYYIGAVAVARVQWAAARLGRQFKFASLYDAENCGIEGWIESQGRRPIPVQIQASRGTHASDFLIVTPHSGVAVENRMTFAWPYLAAAALPERILLLDVDAYEGGGGKGGSASAHIEGAYGLLEALHAGIRSMES